MKKATLYLLFGIILLSKIIVTEVIAQKYNYVNQEILNSPYAEDNPILSADGNKIFFNSTRYYEERYWAKSKKVEGRYDYDIYFSKKVNGEWTPPVNLGKNVNTSEDEMVVSISPDGNVVYYLSFNKDWRITGGPFYKAELHGAEWINIVGFGGGINNFFRTYPGVIYIAGATMSPFGKEFYFSTNICSENGIFDIWVSQLKNNEWAYPRNLGPRINAKKSNNSYPCMSYDGRTLYYSSNGFSGYGNKEILFSILRDDGWSLPLNVGNSINTGSDEYQMTMPSSEESIYMVSEREGGKGSTDIYTADLTPDVSPSKIVRISGRILDAYDLPIEVEVIIEDLSNPEIKYSTWSNSKTGEYTVVVPPGGNYKISFQKSGYLFASSNYEIPAADSNVKIVKDQVVQPLNYVSGNIFFESGKSNLLPESMAELDRIIKLLKENESVELEVYGFTDNVGAPEYNQKLSEERAKSVRMYIIENGKINPKRIKAIGFGEEKPIADNNTEEGRQKNRRTEFKFIV